MDETNWLRRTVWMQVHGKLSHSGSAEPERPNAGQHATVELVTDGSCIGHPNCLGIKRIPDMNGANPIDNSSSMSE
jgi:hypothetical protein